MKFTFTIKPSIITAQDRDGLMRIITKDHSMTHYFAKNMSGVLKTLNLYSRHRDDNKVRVYNIIKVNRKYKQVKDKGGRTKKSVLARDKWYIAYVYDFNVDVLNYLNLDIKQHRNYFRITKVK